MIDIWRNLIKHFWVLKMNENLVQRIYWLEMPIKITKDHLIDHVHLNEKGYRIWDNALYPLIGELVGNVWLPVCFSTCSKCGRSLKIITEFGHSANSLARKLIATKVKHLVGLRHWILYCFGPYSRFSAHYYRGPYLQLANVWFSDFPISRFSNFLQHQPLILLYSLSRDNTTTRCVL